MQFFNKRQQSGLTASYILLTGICTFEKHAFYVAKFTFTIDNKYRKTLKRFSKLESYRKRRDRLYIIAQILTIAKDGCLKTQIMYRANLSFGQLNEYISFLTKMDLLKVKNENRRSTYRITAKGEKYLDKYKDLANI